MTDLVEDVARVIARTVADGDDIDIQEALENGFDWITADQASAMCEAAARAVIPVVLERLREPTPAMLDAFVSRALQVSIDGEGGWSNYGRNQWRAMLDAAIRGLGE